MASRRCFSDKIVESDVFLKMSDSAQALYLHLNMSADDDGFVNSAQSIAGNTKKGKAALSELVERRFLLRFGDVFVIKHWRMSNSLKNDRLKPLNYANAAKQIWVKPNRAYTDHPVEGCVTLYEIKTGIHLESNRNPTGIPTEENRTEPNRTEENRTEENPGEGGFQKILSQYPQDKIGNRQAALDAFKQAFVTTEDVDIALVNLEGWKKCDQWTKDGGRYIPYLNNWILRGAWKSNPCPGSQGQARELDEEEMAAVRRMMEDDEI